MEEKNVVNNAEIETVNISEQPQNGEIKSVKVKKNKKEIAVSYLTKISFLTALSVVLLMLEFPIFPPPAAHLKLNISDVPALLASFMFGPITGCIVNALKVGICLLVRGTSTVYVGDLSNLISGTIYALVAGLIYKYKKTKIGAIIALAISSIAFCSVMWICNQFLLLPFFGVPDEVIMPTLWWTLLFNVIKVVVTCVATFFAYKGLHRMFNKF